jgi:hypothetical protein
LQQISDMPVLDARIVVISLVLSFSSVEHLNQNIYVRYLGLRVVVFTPVHIDSITCGSILLIVELCTPFAVHGIMKYVRCYLRSVLMFIYYNTVLIVDSSRFISVHWILFFW